MYYSIIRRFVTVSQIKLCYNRFRMEKKQINEKQAAELCAWYEKNKRALPWRDTGNPYDVWLSEIMLQQTRIEAVRERFREFRTQLPSIADVANCEDDRLMRLWEGMGYYSRARNLKKCAAVLCEQYGGEFPADVNALKRLPGIGPYTAGAIASICFDLPVCAVDGNVMRVISRLCLIEDDIRDTKTKAEIEKLLSPVLNHETVRPSVFNQALMELGETVCLPNGRPACERCPLRDSCLACAENATDRIPYRSKLKDRSIEKRTLLIIRDGERFLMNRRPDTGLLASLYEFYGVERWLNEKEALAEVERLGLSPLRIHPLPESKHVFSHKEWHMKAWEILVEDASDFRRESMVLVTKKELASLAVPSAFRTYTDWYSLRG